MPVPGVDSAMFVSFRRGVVVRVAIFAVGTRGDVQPAAVLGAELIRRGHEVIMGLPGEIASFGIRMGVEVSPIGAEPLEFMGSEEVRRWLGAGDVRQVIKGFMDFKRQNTDRIAEAMAEASDGADLIVSGILTEDEAACIAEWRQVPMVGLHHAPLRQNSAFPLFVLSTRRLPGAVNRMMYPPIEFAGWRVIAADVNRLRRRLGLPPTREPTPTALARAGATEIQAFSRFLVPELEHWDQRRPLVGFLGLSPEQRRLLGEDKLDPAVDVWLDEGEPPVYFGFGSMPIHNARGTLALIERVSRSLGVRALVSAGWTDLPAGISSDGQVCVVGALDHDAVLPRCRVAVHHGGAGTTAASIGAGLPTVVCSVLGDQPFWGARLQRLGIGATLRFSDLNERVLARAVEPLLHPGRRERVARFAAQLKSDDAPGRTADILEQVHGSRPPRPRAGS